MFADKARPAVDTGGVASYVEDLADGLQRSMRAKEPLKRNLMQLRYYQQEAVNACYKYLRDQEGNPCIVLPTGAGKTPVMATICKDIAQYGERVMVLAHVKELLEQTANTLAVMTDNVEIGVYSAGLKRRDLTQPVIVAGIQSVYKRAFEFGNANEKIDWVIVDECHLIPPKEGGMYRDLLKDLTTANPDLKVVGLTATPYRMSSGMVCGPDNILQEICYEVGVKELIVKGYLSPLISKSGMKRPDTSKLRKIAGEFAADEVSKLMDTESLVFSACHEIVAKTVDRNSVLIFSPSIVHAEHVVEALSKLVDPETIGLITGKTPAGERRELLERFKGKIVDSDLFGEKKPVLKYLVNIGVLTTGFDATNIDCVVLFRITASPGLYYQMVGRGFRLDPSKKNCLILDYGNNIVRHGPVDSMVISENRFGGHGAGVGDVGAKVCPECQLTLHIGYGVCPECGYEFANDVTYNHDGSASEESILSGVIEESVCDVRRVDYNQHIKKKAPEGAPTTLRVEYRIGFNDFQSEYICLEHTGFARTKAEAWWKKRSDLPCQDNVPEALDVAMYGKLAEPTAITIRSESGKKFDEIVGYVLGPKPEAMTETIEKEKEPVFGWPEGWGDDDEIPF